MNRHPGIEEAQQMLANAGFDPGKIDGIWGKNTKTALAKALQKPATAKPLSDAELVVQVISQSLQLLPANMDTPQARLLLLAISGQEADFHHRWQVFDAKRPEAMGAARGLWQFEKMGGTHGVLTHPRSRVMAEGVCRHFNISPFAAVVWSQLHDNDVLAGVFARLLCWTSPAAIPAIDDVKGAWVFYLQQWRPGAYWNPGVSEAKKEALFNKFKGYHAHARKTLNL